MNTAHDNKLQEAIQRALKEIAPLIMNGDNTCSDTMSVLTMFTAKLLPVAALHGGVKESPNLDFQRRMVHMGNQMIVVAIENLTESGDIKMFEAIDNLRSMGNRS